MEKYFKIFITHEEYDEWQDKPIYAYCVKEVHIHNDNGYDYGSDDDDPTDEDYDLDAGFFD